MEHTAPTSVFIVEDSRIVRDAMVDMLDTLDNVTVVGSADNASTAISAIGCCHPDYVVLDYQLTGGTGLEVLRALRPKMPDVVFIVLTNHVSAQYRRICMEAGASWFLDKTREFAKVQDIVSQSRASAYAFVQQGEIR